MTCSSVFSHFSILLPLNASLLENTICMSLSSWSFSPPHSCFLKVSLAKSPYLPRLSKLHSQRLPATSWWSGLFSVPFCIHLPTAFRTTACWEVSSLWILWFWVILFFWCLLLFLPHYASLQESSPIFIFPPFSSMTLTTTDVKNLCKGHFKKYFYYFCFVLVIGNWLYSPFPLTLPIAPLSSLPTQPCWRGDGKIVKGWGSGLIQRRSPQTQ